MLRKRQRSVTVEPPSAFTEFMCGVNRQIEDGEEAATNIDSDDLLQCDCVDGELFDIAKLDWVFDTSIPMMSDGILTSMRRRSPNLPVASCEMVVASFHNDGRILCRHE